MGYQGKGEHQDPKVYQALRAPPGHQGDQERGDRPENRELVEIRD